MIPQGVIWQQLRTRALEVIVDGVRLPLPSPETLGSWLEHGAYQVAAINGSKIELDAAETELASALLGDASLYFDSALEQVAFLRQIIEPNKSVGSGWLLVTAYYWSFYIVQAISRLLGCTAVYLDKSRAAKLAGLFGANAKVSPGAYRLKVNASQQFGRKSVLLRRSKLGRAHDLAWTCWFDELSERVALGKTGRNDLDEQTLYELLLETSKVLGKCWPSDLRNVANYIPDMGYRLVRRLNQNFDFLLDPNLSISAIECMSRLKGNSQGLRSDSVRVQTKLASKVLIDAMCLTQNILSLLYREVLDRRHVDRRWHNLRERFVAEQFDGEIWDWPIR